MTGTFVIQLLVSDCFSTFMLKYTRNSIMARLQISVLSCYPTVNVRGKANVTVCTFFGFSQLGGLGSNVGQITITFLVGVGGGT